MQRSKRISRLLICLITLCSSSICSQVKENHLGNLATNTSRTDQIIRDFVVLLHPSWNSLSFDLRISARRSMNPYFGVNQWFFAVTKASAESTVFLGFSPSSTPCAHPEICFIKQDGPSQLSGMIFVSKDRVAYYEGSRPAIAEKNTEFQHSITLTTPMKEVENRLRADGAHFLPSAEKKIRYHMETSGLFSKYGFKIQQLAFCRTAGTSDHPEIAMYWLALTSSSRSRKRFIVTVEPFDGDITSLIMLEEDNRASASCTK
jgi:hypothetical protein